MTEGPGAGLSVERVTVRFEGRSILDGITLQVRPGEVVALLGPSGSGKSTLLRVIAGLQPVETGRVSWHGQDLTHLPAHRRPIGLVFQEGALFPHLDVAGNIAFGLRADHRAARAERVGELLALVGLEGFERRDVTTLSGGERQRVALARSLAPAPAVLLLDEPLAAVDHDRRVALADDLRTVLGATGTTAVYVTHDRAEAARVADRVEQLHELGHR